MTLFIPKFSGLQRSKPAPPSATAATWALLAAPAADAKILRRGDQLGQLKAGLDADIIAKQGDPTAGISAIEHMPSVMNGGVIYKQQNP